MDLGTGLTPSSLCTRVHPQEAFARPQAGEWHREVTPCAKNSRESLPGQAVHALLMDTSLQGLKSLLVDNQHFLQCAGCSTGMLWFSRSLCEEATGAGEEQAEGDAEPATNPVPVSQNVGGAAAPGWARKQGNNGGKSRGSEGDTDHRTLTVIQYSTENWMHFCVNSSELGMLRIL